MACTLLPYIEVSTACPPFLRGDLRREKLLRYGARIALHPSRLKDEPRQGFLSVQFFERGKPLFGYRFSSGDEGLFCDTIFPKKPLYSIARKRRAMTGFYKSTVF